MNNNLLNVANTIDLGKRTMRTIKQNATAALLVKLFSAISLVWLYSFGICHWTDSWSGRFGYFKLTKTFSYKLNLLPAIRRVGIVYV